MAPQLVLVLFAVIGVTTAFTQFPEFQERFAEHSRLVLPPLQELRAENNKIRLEVIHQTLPKIANMTLDLRNNFNSTWEIVENHENTTEDCLTDIWLHFILYRMGGEVAIRSLAMDLDSYINQDAQVRFVPRANWMGRESTRATYQTVQTLGRNRFMDNIGDTTEELQDELDYHQNLWAGYEEALEFELGTISYLQEDVMELLDTWYVSLMEWQEETFAWIIGSIDIYCVD